MNTTEEVATKLVDYCRKGEWRKALDDLYADDIVSVEAHEMENMPAEMRGIDQVRGKTDWWEKNMEVHSAKIGGPFVARDTFVVQFDIDVTEKTSKKRMQMSRGRARTPKAFAKNSRRLRGISDVALLECDAVLASLSTRRSFRAPMVGQRTKERVQS